VFILNQLGWTADNVDANLAKVSDKQVKLSWPAKVGSGFALSILSAPISSIVDSAVALSHVENGDAANGWLKTHSAGSGSFVIRSYTPHDSLILDANPKAPGGAPLLAGIILKNVPDASARRLLVEQGDADVARDLGADQIAALQGKAGLSVKTIPSSAVYYLAFNVANADNAALKNPALWEASRWLIDYNGIAAKLLKGTWQVHQAFLPDGFPGALKDNPYKLDVGKAKSILAKAGLKDVSVKITVFNQPPYQDIAANLQSTFSQAGITLNIESVVGSELYAKVRSRTHEAAFLFWIPDYFDAHSNASFFAVNREDGNKTIAWRNGWVIPALSDKTQSAVEAQDPKVRDKLYGEIQKEVRDTSPLIVAFQGTDQVVVRSNVKGYVQGLNADQVYFDKVSK
jgi:peptide/nickel transport system substrate-binding protein